MNLLDSYNRVSSLTDGGLNRLLKILIWLLVLVSILGLLAGLQLGFGADFYWQSAATVVLAIAFVAYRHGRRNRCRFCGSELEMVQRTLVMKPHHFEMEGIKGDQCFYHRGREGDKSEWMKLSHRGLACHTCRLVENGYQEINEPLTPQEMKFVVASARQQNKQF
jgi:hypothetical protein